MKGEHFGWKDLYDMMGVEQDFSGGKNAVEDDLIDVDDEGEPG